MAERIGAMASNRRESQAKLAVGAETNKLKAGVVRLPIDEDQVGADVAVAVIVPFPREGMIHVTAGQRLISGEHVHHLHEKRIQLLAKDA